MVINRKGWGKNVTANCILINVSWVIYELLGGWQGRSKMRLGAPTNEYKSVPHGHALLGQGNNVRCGKRTYLFKEGNEARKPVFGDCILVNFHVFALSTHTAHHKFLWKLRPRTGRQCILIISNYILVGSLWKLTNTVATCAVMSRGMKLTNGGCGDAAALSQCRLKQPLHTIIHTHAIYIFLLLVVNWHSNYILKISSAKKI